MNLLDALVDELGAQPKQPGEVSVGDLAARGIGRGLAQRMLLEKVKAGELRRRRGMENGRATWFYSKV